MEHLSLVPSSENYLAAITALAGSIKNILRWEGEVSGRPHGLFWLPWVGGHDSETEPALGVPSVFHPVNFCKGGSDWNMTIASVEWH